MISDKTRLTYRQLEDRSDDLARHLCSLGVTRGSLVGLCVERSPEMIIALLAILKAGGAYVPLDPAYPEARLRYLLEDARLRWVLADGKSPTGGGPSLLPVEIIPLADALLAGSRADAAPSLPAPAVCPEDAAYIIYTSGSTGRPKGVVVTHANLLHSTNARLSYYREPLSAFLLLSSFAFDSSVAGIFWTLCAGGTLVLPEPGAERDCFEINRLTAGHRVSHLLCLPSLYLRLLDHAAALRGSLRVAIVAGEPCPPAVVRRHFGTLPDTALYNEYGPTEATVWSTVHRAEPGANAGVGAGVGEDPAASVPIGFPIPGATIRLLRTDSNEVPRGETGEIYIGGPGVAQGYLHRPELTNERFLLIDGARLYRTGDLGRRRPDGALEFIGRIDHQVKIRGFRIEPGEIEAMLREHPEVYDAAVVARERQGESELIAYVITGNGSDHGSGSGNGNGGNRGNDRGVALASGGLRAWLRRKLPGHMIPSAFVQMEVFPITANGKVDRHALPDPPFERPRSQAQPFAPAKTELEKTITRIWADVIGTGNISIYDNFFEAGGTSLRAAEVQAQLTRAVGRPVAAATLFQYPTVASLAGFLSAEKVKHATVSTITDRARRQRQAYARS